MSGSGWAPASSSNRPTPRGRDCGCVWPVLSDILSDMKTVTLRALRRDASLLDAAAEGQEILVTRFNRPYVRIVPAGRPRSFLGAGRHLNQKEAVAPDPVPASEWKGLA